MSLLEYNPPKNNLDIVYYNDHFVVINKPSGLLSVSGREERFFDSAMTRVKEKYGYAEPAHRLDMGTSGLLLFALSRKADAELKRQFRDREVKKSYYALVYNHLFPSNGIIDLPLVCDWHLRPRQRVCFVDGKQSITKYTVEKYFDDNTCLVKLEPITGRTHQLRVHLASLGSPIIGDKFYANDYIYNMSDNLLLHSSELFFKNPITGEDIKLFNKPDFLDKEDYLK